MIAQLMLYTGIAGITVFLGGLLSWYFQHHVEDNPVKYIITHTMMSFGAGVILSAVVLVLVPEGTEALNILSATLCFAAGTVSFLLLDQYLNKRTGRMATLMAMMMDFVPESIALGATFVTDPSTAILLSVFIGFQNLPEAFCSFRDLVISGFSVKRTLSIFAVFSTFGIFAALLGYYWLTSRPELTAMLMVFAGGGILYLLIRDIIPDSKYERSYKTSLGASAGFLLGMVGYMIFQ